MAATIPPTPETQTETGTIIMILKYLEQVSIIYVLAPPTFYSIEDGTPLSHPAPALLQNKTSQLRRRHRRTGSQKSPVTAQPTSMN